MHYTSRHPVYSRNESRTLGLSGHDDLTYLRHSGTKPSPVMSRHPQLPQQRRAPEMPISRTMRNTNVNPHINTISVLKNELYSLKQDFSDFFSQEPIRSPYPQLASNRSGAAHSKSPRVEEEFDGQLSVDYKETTRYHPSKIVNVVQFIEEENLSLKGELRRLRLKYQDKKKEYKEGVKFLNKKINYLEDQVLTNEENMMDCKNQLETEMDAIRDQLTRKKDAQISLEDYGELIQINSHLKDEIQVHLATIEQVRLEVQVSLRKQAQAEKVITHLSEERKTLQEKLVVLSPLQQENTRLSNTVSSLRSQLQLAEVSRKTSQNSLRAQMFQIQAELVGLKDQIRGLQEQNCSLRDRELQNMQTIGQLNADLMESSHHLQRAQQQSQIQERSNSAQESSQASLQEVQSLTEHIRELGQIKFGLQQDRSAMLQDIQFFQKQLDSKHQENTYLRQIIVQREDEIMYLRTTFGEAQFKRFGQALGLDIESQGVVQKKETVFLQSEQVSQEVTKDFQGILNSPKSPFNKRLGHQQPNTQSGFAIHADQQLFTNPSIDQVLP